MKNEDELRRSFAEKLEDYGWDYLEEAWLVKAGTRFRGDIVASHPEYDELGYFLFELKTPKGGFRDVVTKVHKQMVYRYIGSQINDFRWPTVKESPQVFVYKCPCKETTGTWYEWYVIKRFFNRYGIGLLFPGAETIVFDPDKSHWACLHLNPKMNNPHLDMLRLKKYLEERTFGLE